MRWDVILFDLDGTITDPKEGITKSVAYALNGFGFKIEDPDTLTHFIGPPLRESFMDCYGMDEESAACAIKMYRERYSSIGWKENVLYSGVSAFLQQLKDAGKTILIATSKAQPYAVQIMEYFGLDVYFDHICGTSFDDLNATKADVIQRALKLVNLDDYNRAVMVGDRFHDVDGAHKVGIAAVGVLYGYGSLKELEQHGADYIVEDISELSELLLL